MKALMILAILASSTASGAQVRPSLAMGPKQDDPRTCDGTGGRGAGAVQMPGGKVAGGERHVGGFNPETDPRAHGGVETMGPKQDDPTAPGQGLAMGPKQDDPRTADALGGKRVLSVPKGAGPAKLSGKFNPETDPRAAAGTGTVAMGPKQDDPTAPGQSLAMGPKQDDPTAPGLRRGALAMSDNCGSGGQAPLPKPGK